MVNLKPDKTISTEFFHCLNTIEDHLHISHMFVFQMLKFIDLITEMKSISIGNYALNK